MRASDKWSPFMMHFSKSQLSSVWRFNLANLLAQSGILPYMAKGVEH